MPNLITYVVNQYAIHWKVLGIKLGLEDHQIEEISYNNKYNPNRAQDSCIDMLRLWLKAVLSPTWGKLSDAINEVISVNFTKGNLCLYLDKVTGHATSSIKV